MKFKCTECGKIYTDKVQYCECGNDNFKKILTAAERKRQNEEILYNEPKKKENIFLNLLFFIILIVGVYFLCKYVASNINKKAEKNDEYENKVMHAVFDGFSPQGIEKSGHCLVQFEINENGEITNQKIVETSNVYELDNKVFYSVKNAPKLEAPPKAYLHKPIKIDFICFVKNLEVECYSKNVTD